MTDINSRIDKKYDIIVSFYDGDIKHVRDCQNTISNYKIIDSADQLRKSVEIVNNLIKPLLLFYEEPVDKLLVASRNAKSEKYITLLKSSNESIELLLGMIETLKQSPIGIRLNNASFDTVPNYFFRLRDKIHFFDSILLQNTQRLIELKPSFVDYNDVEVFKELPDLQLYLRMMSLAYEDRWRVIKKLLEALG